LNEAPTVSVIIASYCPGEGLNRVIDSLDAQTLPQDEFEVIFVDDGSPDDTYARLEQIASTRHNMHITRIENSGWPSRPRNVGIERASGEYLVFMDHDDSLYPDALRSAYEYAKANNADVLVPKESKTNDVFWGLSALVDGNVPNALTHGGIDCLLPMVPHKLYRRQLFIDHHIRFPEGGRVLWEDQFINIEAYRHAKVISVRADTPFYLWHASDTNTSHTFDPSTTEFWDRLNDIMTFIEKTLDGSAYHDAQVTLLAHQVRGRVIERLLRLLTAPNQRSNLANLWLKAMAVRRARRLLRRFGSDDVLAALHSKKHQAQAHLLRRGKVDLMTSFYGFGITAGVSVRSMEWQDARLRLDIECVWQSSKSNRPAFKQVGGRTRLAVTSALERAIPPALLDVTDDAQSVAVELALRSRTGHVSWGLPYKQLKADFRPNEAGALTLVSSGVCYLDTEAAAVGAPLADEVWDFRYRTAWDGRARRGAIPYNGKAMPAVYDGRGAVAYSNASKSLSIDLAQRMRTLVIDAKPRAGTAGAMSAFSVPLDNIAVFGDTTLGADMVVAIPDGSLQDGMTDQAKAEVVEQLAAGGRLGGKIVADADGARFEGGASLRPGRYTLYARRVGKLHRTLRSLVVDEAGQAQFA
jgi:glycosyltransferase involved in cell wall biosynthesis